MHPRRVYGLRVFNYNKSTLECYRGAKYIRIQVNGMITGVCILVLMNDRMISYSFIKHQELIYLIILKSFH